MVKKREGERGGRGYPVPASKKKKKKKKQFA
jgi:hypothetical protein